MERRGQRSGHESGDLFLLRRLEPGAGRARRCFDEPTLHPRGAGGRSRGELERGDRREGLSLLRRLGALHAPDPLEWHHPRAILLRCLWLSVLLRRVRELAWLLGPRQPLSFHWTGMAE